jgi:hypothetical protein
MVLVFYTNPEAPCAMRGGDQPRAQGTSASTTSDGNPQRSR